MGHTFFNDLKTGEKEIRVSFLVETSAAPKQLIGMKELLRMKNRRDATPKPSTSKSNMRGSSSKENDTIYENESSNSGVERSNSEHSGDESASSESEGSEDEQVNSEDETPSAPPSTPSNSDDESE